MDKKNKTKSILKDKRAEVTDVMVAGFWLLTIAIGILSLMLVITSLVPPLENSPLGDDNATLAAINSLENYGTVALPSTFLIIFFGLVMGILISSFFVRTHPIFLAIYILFGMASVIVAVALGNTWGALRDIQAYADLIALNSTVGAIDTIMSNMVLFTVIVFILSLIVIFAKPGGGAISQGGSSPY